MADTLNPHSGAVRRLKREVIQLARDPPEMFAAAPLDENLFEWHFTIRGGKDTPHEGGLYHGRILIPPAYPHKPPDVVFLTPNGRFKVNEKICLSITGYHPEQWSAVWDIRAALTALIAFLPTPPEGAIGSLDYSDEEKRRLAKISGRYTCKICGVSNAEMMPELVRKGNNGSSEEPPSGDEKSHPKGESTAQLKTDQKELRKSDQKKIKNDDSKQKKIKNDDLKQSKASKEKEQLSSTKNTDSLISMLIVILSIIVAVLLSRKIL